VPAPHHIGKTADTDMERRN